MAAKPKMKKADLKYFENLINKKIGKLKNELGYMETTSLGNNNKEKSGDLSSHSLHMADQASDNIEQEQNFLLAERESQFMHHLNEAMYRIKQGTYGICKECEIVIPKARLEAVPNATMCIKCKEDEQEKKRRLTGH